MALIADIEGMFHQVKVVESDRDFLRYIWWQDDNYSHDPSVYRMTSHLFGGTWNPSCCSFALHRTATNNQLHHDAETVKTVLRNFYVDDCLKSVRTEEDGINLVKDLCDLLDKGGFKLTKWISNNRHVLHVLQTIPEERKAKGIVNGDLDYDALPTQRALGVY